MISSGSLDRNTTVANVATLSFHRTDSPVNPLTTFGLDGANTTYDTPDQERSGWVTVFLAIILAIIVVLTVIGNVLVIASIVANANLRTTTYYFIANLAIADLLLGTTVLPFSATLEVLQYWAFGHVFCDVWAAIDVLCCTASILSLCVISIDRYIGVTRPLHHGRIMRQTRTVYVIIFVWLLSVAISVAPLIGWKEDPNPDPRVCTVTTQPGYVLFSVAGSFYIPCLIILIVYFRIYREALIYTRCLMSGAKMSKVDQDNVVALRIHLGRDTKGSHQQDKYHVVTDDDLIKDCRSSTSQYSIKKLGKNNSRRTFLNRVAKFNREKKAAKTLGIVVGVFIICWLPFFIILPLDSLCTDCSVPPVLFKLFFWLGYCNSTVNPVIYTCSSVEFRRAFLGILCCRRCSKRPRVILTEFRTRGTTLKGGHRPAFRQKRQQELQPQAASLSSSRTKSATKHDALLQKLVSKGSIDSENTSLCLTDCPDSADMSAYTKDDVDNHNHNRLCPLPSKFETSAQTVGEGKPVSGQNCLPLTPQAQMGQREGRV